MSLLKVRSTSGALVPIEAVARLRQTVGPFSVAHIGQTPSATLSFNLTPGPALSEAVAQVEALAATALPASVSSTFQGAAEAYANSLQGLGVLLLIATLVIYLVLGALYEDFIHPITILSGLPAASVGALVTLLIFGQELNIYGYVGLIMLIGIVKKNAIMMIDFALEARKLRQRSAEEAILEACLVRFRPIMMTTLAALAGSFPIVMGMGAGAESRRSLGLAVFGGLLLSQFLTLYVTPVFYICLEKLFARKQSVSALVAAKPA